MSSSTSGRLASGSVACPASKLDANRELVEPKRRPDYNRDSPCRAGSVRGGHSEIEGQVGFLPDVGFSPVVEGALPAER